MAILTHPPCRHGVNRGVQVCPVPYRHFKSRSSVCKRPEGCKRDRQHDEREEAADPYSVCRARGVTGSLCRGHFFPASLPARAVYWVVVKKFCKNRGIFQPSVHGHSRSFSLIPFEKRRDLERMRASEGFRALPISPILASLENPKILREGFFCPGLYENRRTSWLIQGFSCRAERKNPPGKFGFSSGAGI